MKSLSLLDNDDLEALSGYKQPKKQVEWLRQWAVPHFVAKDGHPRVLRSDVEGAEKKLKIQRREPRLQGLAQRVASVEKT